MKNCICLVILFTEFAQKALLQRCGGTLRSPSGWISSPDKNEDWENAEKYCEWVVVAAENKAIELHFLKLDIVPITENCVSNGLNVMDGPMRLATHCGRDLPPNVISEARVVQLQFWAYSEPIGEGFNLTYRQIEDPTCGYRVTFLAGLISPPDMDGDGRYEELSDCRWIIYSLHGKIIQLYFEAMEIEPTGECEYDYLEIIVPVTGSLGKYCGDDPPDLISVNATALVLAFHTNSRMNYAGFTAVYAYTDERQCGGILTEPMGTISMIDVDRDGKYDNGECVWAVVAAQGYTVKLTFTSMVIAWAETCSYDRIEVHDGHYPFDGLVGKYCGRDPPATILSETNVVIVRFFLTQRFTRSGFNIVYETQIMTSTAGTTASADDRTSISTQELRSLSTPEHSGATENAQRGTAIICQASLILVFNLCNSLG